MVNLLRNKMVNLTVFSKGNPLSTYRFYVSEDKKEYFINPYTAELSGRRVASSAFIRIVTTIHRTLLVPKIGRYIVGLAALSLIILTISYGCQKK